MKQLNDVAHFWHDLAGTFVFDIQRDAAGNMASRFNSDSPGDLGSFTAAFTAAAKKNNVAWRFAMNSKQRWEVTAQSG